MKGDSFMLFKKLTAAVLTVATLAGFTGCNLENKRNTDAIIKVTDKYVEALSEMDSEAILDISDWDEDDDEYKEIKFVLGFEFMTDTVLMDKICECYEYIASTIEYSYEDGRITLEKDNATLKIQYKMVDWKSIFAGSYASYDDVLAALKNSDDTIIVKDTLKFVKEKGDWKLSKVSKFNEAFSFVYALPNVGMDPQPTETDPTDTEPTESKSQQDLEYAETVRAYLAFMKEHEKAIKQAEKIYSKPFVTFYDLDGNGVLDMIFVSADNVNDNYSSASLHIYTYDLKTKQVIEKITVPEIAYTAEGGCFYIYVTEGAFVVSHRYGEAALQHVYTDVYSLDFEEEYNIPGFSVLGSFRRDVYYEYDPVNDKENYKYEYFFAQDGVNYKTCEEAIYKDSVGSLAEKVLYVIGYDYLPQKDDVEYPMVKEAGTNFDYYDDIVECYKNY